MKFTHNRRAGIAAGLAFVAALVAIGVLMPITRAHAKDPSPANTQPVPAISPDGSTQLPITITGGYDTDPKDHGRPVILIAAALNVPAETFADWALRIFGTSNIDPNADPDHDGANNMQEFRADTDPLNAGSVFKFINIQPAQPNGIIIQWSAVVGKTYTLQRSAIVRTN